MQHPLASRVAGVELLHVEAQFFGDYLGGGRLANARGAGQQRRLEGRAPLVLEPRWVGLELLRRVTVVLVPVLIRFTQVISKKKKLQKLCAQGMCCTQGFHINLVHPLRTQEV